MTFKEAAERIETHNRIHAVKEYPFAIKITEALDMAVRLLLWAEEQPEWTFEGNIIDLVGHYYNQGVNEGFHRAEMLYDIKDEK